MHTEVFEERYTDICDLWNALTIRWVDEWLDIRIEMWQNKYGKMWNLWVGYINVSCNFFFNFAIYIFEIFQDKILEKNVKHT